MTTIPLLAPTPVAFPDPNYALREPDGLVAAGGALTLPWLLEAYSRGLFPWFDSDDEHILWWSPSIRAVLRPGTMKVTRSLAKRIRNAGFELSMDEAFEDVVNACAAPRDGAHGTWITTRMKRAYQALFDHGYAHSVEVRRNGNLCGGLYGVSIGGVFCGESMFSREKDASKIALYAIQRQLAAWDFTLLDCQIMNPHLARLGVVEMPRAQYLQLLKANEDRPNRLGRWRFD